MSARGRCSGCQETGELKRITWHVLSCLKWAALYQRDPDAALPPSVEFERWQREERAAEHQRDLERRVADTQAQQRASVARFTVADPLED
jgi:hypothetical protein